MMKEAVIIVLYVILILIGATVIAGISVSTIRGPMQAEAVKHGCAQYDPITGEWGWKKEKPE